MVRSSRVVKDLYFEGGGRLSGGGEGTSGDGHEGRPEAGIWVSCFCRPVADPSFFFFSLSQRKKESRSLLLEQKLLVGE